MVALISVLAIVLAACATQPSPERTVPEANLDRGAALYNQYCLGCHGGATGGSMMDLPPPHNANGHTWHHPDCELVEIVLHGSGKMGAMMRRMMGTPEHIPRMPAFRDTLSLADVEAILWYIQDVVDRRAACAAGPGDATALLTA
jgi:mono/diheme cytochrome c family protein